VRALGGAIAVALRTLLVCVPCRALGGPDQLGDLPPPPATGDDGERLGIYSICNGECAISVFGGQQVLTHLSDIVFHGQLAPWNWRWGDSELVGGSISRRIWTLWGGAADFEPEIGIAKRLGDIHTDEAWLALYLRWNRFPWDRYLRTSVALNLGVSAAVDLPSGAHAATFFNYCSPQVTFALPQYPQYQLLVQMHHRSDVGFWDGKDPGWQYLTVGLRYKF
jgi:hypothetical protein